MWTCIWVHLLLGASSQYHSCEQGFWGVKSKWTAADLVGTRFTASAFERCWALVSQAHFSSGSVWSFQLLQPYLWIFYRTRQRLGSKETTCHRGLEMRKKIGYCSLAIHFWFPVCTSSVWPAGSCYFGTHPKCHTNSDKGVLFLTVFCGSALQWDGLLTVLVTYIRVKLLTLPIISSVNSWCNSGCCHNRPFR